MWEIKTLEYLNWSCARRVLFLNVTLYLKQVWHKEDFRYLNTKSPNHPIIVKLKTCNNVSQSPPPCFIFNIHEERESGPMRFPSGRGHRNQTFDTTKPERWMCHGLLGHCTDSKQKGKNVTSWNIFYTLFCTLIIFAASMFTRQTRWSQQVKFVQVVH